MTAPQFTEAERRVTLAGVAVFGTFLTARPNAALGLWVVAAALLALLLIPRIPLRDASPPAAPRPSAGDDIRDEAAAVPAQPRP
ncbi:hypothetical protein [Phenylobacterium sp.]|uniref:hypothetical protein n=1 Tax=Phenylobacterium sp. TaxID=1871053 RepID=UPI00286B5E6D|nr:hypothetical protein [Phenylobacterium sp.]